jgi:multidrug efflux pump
VKRFNLSEWALAHQPLIRYLIVALAIVGVMSYQKLGQSEDPPFTFKVMVVRPTGPAPRPGRWRSRSPTASRRSCRRCPMWTSCAAIRAPASRWCSSSPRIRPRPDVPELFYQVRKKIGDIKGQLPAACAGRSSTTSSATCSATSTP